MSFENLEFLRHKYRNLYATTLPTLARNKHPSQPIWPVHLDHCFARIILDNTISVNADTGLPKAQWDALLKRPAIMNMTATQLTAATELGERIKDGSVDLVELDRRSLTVRGKAARKYGVQEQRRDNGKRKSERVIKEDAVKEVEKAQKKPKKSEPDGRQSRLSFKASPLVANKKNEQEQEQEQKQKQLSSPTSLHCIPRSLLPHLENSILPLLHTLPQTPLHRPPLRPSRPLHHLRSALGLPALESSRSRQWNTQKPLRTR